MLKNSNDLKQEYVAAYNACQMAFNMPNLDVLLLHLNKTFR